ncbi:MAG: glutathione S-transferase family protein [Pseudomonadota bacterium]
MTAVNSLEQLVEDANADLDALGQSFVFGAPEGETPRFELYHAPFSICSQKVRTVLIEKGLAFSSHHLDLPVSETHASDSYRPSYVRLRLRGAPDGMMVSGYTGQSSVAVEGFDPCVVPTLIDHAHERVVVDALKICEYLDQEAETGQRLIPGDIAEDVSAQVALIDQAPHPALLYGASPEGEDIRPEIVAIPITGSLGHAVRHIQTIKASVTDEPELVSAYDAKIVRQSSAEKFIYNRDAMLEAYARMADHVARLEDQLSKHGGEWTFGNRYTMADIMWSASLFRLKWLGLGPLWEEDGKAPRVRAYVDKAFMRPGFRQAVINWPMATPPSHHIEPSAPYAQELFSAWKAMRASVAE